jgi:hypothetical protein
MDTRNSQVLRAFLRTFVLYGENFTVGRQTLEMRLTSNFYQLAVSNFKEAAFDATIQIL